MHKLKREEKIVTNLSRNVVIENNRKPLINASAIVPGPAYKRWEQDMKIVRELFGLEPDKH